MDWRRGFWPFHARPVPDDALPTPVETGTVVDHTDVVWVIRRRRLDLRMVKRLLLDKPTAVIVDHLSGGLEWVYPDDRKALWEQVRPRYAGPGGRITAKAEPWVEYMGHEFSGPDDLRMLYLEVWC